MNTEALHRKVLIASFILCVFLFADSYIIPAVELLDQITDLSDSTYRLKRSTGHTYVVTTTNHSYDVTKALFNFSDIGDTIILHKSIITNSLQEISVVKGDKIYTFPVGFIRARTGFIYTAIITIGIIIFFAFYTRLKNIQGRRNMTYFLLICSILLLLFHLDLDII
jgi:hypothetical protein